MEGLSYYTNYLDTLSSTTYTILFDTFLFNSIHKKKWSCYRPGVAQRVGRGIALLFHDRSTRRGWVVSSKPWPQFTPGEDPVPILQEAGWAPGLVWTGGKSHPHRDLIPEGISRECSLLVKTRQSTYILMSHQKNTWFCHNTKYNIQNIQLFGLSQQHSRTA